MSHRFTGDLNSWGNFPPLPQEAVALDSLDWSEWPKMRSGSFLPRGNGRSYGDSCLSRSGLLIETRFCDRILEFDRDAGLIRLEAGALFSEILPPMIRAGWFLPVTPGTQFVTIAGAVANDVHGKNHHVSGSIGDHVDSFELQRSDGEILTCSRAENADLFFATLGGLGLTGLIRTVRLRLKRIHGTTIDSETIKYSSMGEFFEISQASQHFEYTVAWVDCLKQGSGLGRGHFIRGNHSTRGKCSEYQPKPPSALMRVPLQFPDFALSSWNVKAFNELYFHRQRSRFKKVNQRFEPFFYPLDGIQDWNRIYGSRGFLQYQFVLPLGERCVSVLQRMMRKIAESKQASFLVVMKIFGESQTGGMLSFPMPGVTVAIDFPNRGVELLRLLQDLDQEVLREKGRVYPAKDARMSADHFKSFFPRWKEFQKWIDPRISSAFSERVGLTQK